MFFRCRFFQPKYQLSVVEKLDFSKKSRLENLEFVKDRNTTFKLFEVDCSLNLNLSRAFQCFPLQCLHPECKSRNISLFPIQKSSSSSLLFSMGKPAPWKRWNSLFVICYFQFEYLWFVQIALMPKLRFLFDLPVGLPRVKERSLHKAGKVFTCLEEVEMFRRGRNV